MAKSSTAAQQGRPRRGSMNHDIEKCLADLYNFRLLNPSDGQRDDGFHHAKFDNMKLSFLHWARTIPAKGLAPKISDPTKKTVQNMITLMEDEERLQEEFGLRRSYEDLPVEENCLIQRFRYSYFAFLQDFLPPYSASKCWVIEQEASFLTFLRLLRELVDNLRTSTSAEWENHLQRAYAATSVSGMTNQELWLVERSGMDEEDFIANAAASKLGRHSRNTKSKIAQISEVTEGLNPGRAYEVGGFNESLASEPIMAPSSSATGFSVADRFYTLVERSFESYGDFLQSTNSISHFAPRRILTELRRFRDAPPLTSLSLIGSSLTDLLGFFVGPPETPYENGIFFVQFKIPDQYPFEPPHCRMVTKIYHPNVDSNGEICLNIFEHNKWQPVWSLWDLLLAIMGVLESPYDKGLFGSGVAQIYKYNRREFNKIARSWTEKFATGEWPQKHLLQQEFQSYHDKLPSFGQRQVERGSITK